MLSRKFATIVFFCLFAPIQGVAFGQAPGKVAVGGASTDRDLEQALLKMTEEFTAAEVNGDIATLDRLLAHNFAHTHSTGRVATKAKDIEDLKSGSRDYESFTLEGVEARVYGSAGITLGRAHITVRNGTRTNTNYVQFLSVWAVQQGQWRMVAWQTTHVK